MAWNAIGLPMANDGLLIESLGVRAVEDGTRRNQRIGNGLAGGLADPQFNAGGIDALLLGQVLPCVEGAFSSGGRLLAGCRVSHDDEPCIGLLIEG